MTKQENLELFDNHVEFVIKKLLEKGNLEIDLLNEKGSITKEVATEVIEGMNRTINLLCGEDEELYDEYRFRLFKTPKGDYQSIQGKEINVDIRRKHA